MSDMHELIEKTNRILEEDSRELSEGGRGLFAGVSAIAADVYNVKQSIENLEGMLEYHIRGRGSSDNDGNTYMSGKEKARAMDFEKAVKALNDRRDSLAKAVTELKKKAKEVDRFMNT